MYLKRLLVSDFKNIREAELFFSPKINSISGNNGAGKTNLMDAIYYLSMTKSYFNASDAYTFTHGKTETVLNGIYRSSDSSEEKISIRVRSEGSKIIRKNDKVYQRISDHIGAIPIVMVSPADTFLINGSGEERRKFMNSLLSQVDKEYLYRIQRYNHLLAQRNKLLKENQMQEELLQTITERMSPDALYIYEARARLAGQLQELTNCYYYHVSGNSEEISLSYVSDMAGFSHSGETACLNLLNSVRQRDYLLKYTSAGIQKDDLDFHIMGYPLKRCGSQGQQKSFLVALKLAQSELMRRLHGVEPILLLDDVFDKLDMQRVGYLLKLVSGENFGQIFITESNKLRLERLTETIGSDVKFFNVDEGTVTEIRER